MMSNQDNLEKKYPTWKFNWNNKPPRELKYLKWNHYFIIVISLLSVAWWYYRSSVLMTDGRYNDFTLYFLPYIALSAIAGAIIKAFEQQEERIHRLETLLEEIVSKTADESSIK